MVFFAESQGKGSALMSYERGYSQSSLGGSDTSRKSLSKKLPEEGFKSVRPSGKWFYRVAYYLMGVPPSLKSEFTTGFPA